MPQRFDSSCSCPDGDYSAFDSVCSKELVSSIGAGAIINQGDFCTSFQLDSISALGEKVGLRDLLCGLDGKVGLYHVWEQEDYCYEHDRYSMQGLYVGKGTALTRVLRHAQEKLPEADFLSVTFFECKNRIAKYLEQLFLDTYTFRLNEHENPGTLPLYACWDAERRMMGTELHNFSNSKNAPKGDC